MYLFDFAHLKSLCHAFVDMHLQLSQCFCFVLFLNNWCSEYSVPEMSGLSQSDEHQICIRCVKMFGVQV